jgi:hypothetical protein
MKPYPRWNKRTSVPLIVEPHLSNDNKGAEVVKYFAVLGGEKASLLLREMTLII